MINPVQVSPTAAGIRTSQRQLPRTITVSSSITEAQDVTLTRADLPAERQVTAGTTELTRVTSISSHSGARISSSTTGTVASGDLRTTSSPPHNVHAGSPVAPQIEPEPERLPPRRDLQVVIPASMSNDGPCWASGVAGSQSSSQITPRLSSTAASQPRHSQGTQGTSSPAGSPTLVTVHRAPSLMLAKEGARHSRQIGSGPTPVESCDSGGGGMQRSQSQRAAARLRVTQANSHGRNSPTQGPEGSPIMVQPLSRLSWLSGRSHGRSDVDAVSPGHTVGTSHANPLSMGAHAAMFQTLSRSSRSVHSESHAGWLRIVLRWVVAATVVWVGFLALHLAVGQHVAAGFDAVLALICGSGGMHIKVVGAIPDTRIVDGICIVSAVFVCLQDLSLGGRQETWLFAGLGFAGIQTIGSQERAPLAALCGIVCVSIVLRCIEEAANLGLYEALDSNSYSESCSSDCEATAVAAGARRIIFWVSACVLAHTATARVREQQRANTAAVRLAENIAEALVRFDLDRAEQLVGVSMASLAGIYAEEGLMMAFRELVANLRVYRPFLPDGLFAASMAETWPLSAHSVRNDSTTGTSKDGDASPDAVAPMPAERSVPFGVADIGASDDVGAMTGMGQVGTLTGMRQSFPTGAGNPLRSSAPDITVDITSSGYPGQGPGAGSHMGRSSMVSLHPAETDIWTDPPWKRNSSVPRPTSPRSPAKSPRAGRLPRLTTPVNLARIGAARRKSQAARLLNERKGTMRFRRSTLLRCDVSVDNVALTEAALTAITRVFVTNVLTVGRRLAGITLALNVNYVLFSWNTHAPDPQHAMQGTLCALHIKSALSKDLHETQWALALSSGGMLSGTVGTHDQLALVVAGLPVEIAATLGELGPRISCPCLADEQTYELVRSEILGRVVDAVRLSKWQEEDAPPRDVFVYEVAARRNRQTGEIVLVSAQTPVDYMTDEEAMLRHASAFSALRQMRLSQAKALFSMQLRMYPLDVQARRLLKIVVLLKRRSVQFVFGRDQEMYVRSYTGWLDIEGKCAGLKMPKGLFPNEGADDESDVGQMSPTASRTSLASGTQSPRRMHTSKSGLGSPRASDYITRRSQGTTPSLDDVVDETETRCDTVSVMDREMSDLTVTEVVVPAADHEALRKAIDEARRFRKNQRQSADSSGEVPGSIPRQLTDQRGHVWWRANAALGKGAFGEVFLGMAGDGSLVALKAVLLPRSLRAKERNSFTIHCEGLLEGGCLFPFVQEASNAPTEGTAGGAAALDTLLREVALMSALKHENIVHYLGSALCCEHVVVAMEYVPGGSLHILLGAFDRDLPRTSVQRYLRDVLRGLSFLHHRGVVHRDLKPHNVLVTAEGAGKLADFGASGELHIILAAGAKGAGVFGTPHYMAPEACRGTAGKPADVWSVGIMLCELLTGKLPWDHIEACSPMVFIQRLAETEDMRPNLGHLSELPVARSFAEECLRRNPEDRPNAMTLQEHAFILS